MLQNNRRNNKKYKAYNFGIIAEIIVILILFSKNYRIIAWRYKTRVGEIDIIATKGNLVSFVEVKARSNLSVTDVVAPYQQKRICRCAALFIAKNIKFDNLNKRFDVAIVRPYKIPHYIKNAWDYID